MSVEKAKDTTAKKPATEPKNVEAKAAAPSPAAESKPDASPTRQAMGEGQKAVSQAYKDNWNAIFGNDKKKKKR